MAAPPIPSLTLATGPQITTTTSNPIFSPTFGGDFFGRGAAAQASSGVSFQTIMILGGAVLAVWLVGTGKVKF